MCPTSMIICANSDFKNTQVRCSAVMVSFCNMDNLVDKLETKQVHDSEI